MYAPWDRVPCVKAADEFVADECGIENARLIALCPDAVALLCDMADELGSIAYWDITVEKMRCPLCDVDEDEHEDGCPIGMLLARFASLEGRAR